MSKLSINGLTEEQCKMLDIMWEKENSEDLFEWFKSLSEREFNMAMTLYQMLSQEVTEEYVENNTNLAKEMLEEIGVNVGK